MTRKENGKLNTVLRILEVLLILMVFGIIVSAIFNVKKSNNTAGKERLEDTVRLAVMECYAVEGRYPPSIEYLEEKYALQINKKYSVKYDAFAENMMPDITVVEKHEK